MTDEKFFTFIFACIGFCVGAIAMGLLGRLVGGDAEGFLRVGGLAVGMALALLLWRRTA